MVMDGLNTSIIGRAIEAGLLEINAVNIRDYSTNKHMKVDDYPYGGGAGLVMQPEPVYRAYKDLEKDEYFIADLIGLSVIREDNGEVLGELTDVLQTGANDVYEVKMEDGKEILLPAIRECIKKVDLQKGEITVHVMKGLLDE